MKHFPFKRVSMVILGIVMVGTLIGGASGVQSALLTQTQIRSIVVLLESFGVDNTTVTNVESILTGEREPTTTSVVESSSSTTHTIFSFVSNLSLGDSGPAVKYL
jgi:hypothetical protein